MAHDAVTGITAVFEEGATGAGMDFAGKVVECGDGIFSVHSDDLVVYGIARSEAFDAITGVFLVVGQADVTETGVVSGHGEFDQVGVAIIDGMVQKSEVGRDVGERSRNAISGLDDGVSRLGRPFAGRCVDGEVAAGVDGYRAGTQSAAGDEFAVGAVVVDAGIEGGTAGEMDAAGGKGAVICSVAGFEGASIVDGHGSSNASESALKSAIDVNRPGNLRRALSGRPADEQGAG